MSHPHAASNPTASAVAPGRDARWFEEEVLPHEPGLRAFLRAKFPRVADLDDLVQEAYARLFRARENGKVTNVRAFLYSTARNTGVDQLRREMVSRIDAVADLEQLPVQGERANVADAVARDQELELLRDAVAALPERCRQVLTLRKIEGLGYAEIGRRLGISESTVSAQVQFGMLKVQRYFIERGLIPEDRR